MSSDALSPTWPHPRAPLAPHRLAKLANALGVAAPVPATVRTSPDVADPRRSPTPSASTASFAPPASRFLLHVVPPRHLPHDDALPVPNAPGYHTHFRRGTLVPVHPTLHAQLGAIAREYALPSPVGLILYLVSGSPDPAHDDDEPGPRLSEDVWRHLWARVVRTELHDDALPPSRSQTPHTPRSPLILRLAPAARSTPFLRPPSDAPPAATSPSTPSSASDHHHNKSAPPSVAHSEPDTPDTSVDERGPDFLDLPGLTSPSLIPILAKVEFDIDRRKAQWYDPWLRSRRANHAKRTDSRKTHEADSPVDAPPRSAPIELLTGKSKDTQDAFLDAGKQAESAYMRLSESPDEVHSDSDEDEDEFSEEDATARVNTSLVQDPLADVFGTDEDTWADIRAEGGAAHKHDNPNVVNLALTAGELDALPDPEDDDDVHSTKEEDDVMDLLDKMGKPSLAISIPDSPKAQLHEQAAESARAESPVPRKIPAPLVLKPKDHDERLQTLLTGRDTSADTPRLAYRNSTSGSERGGDANDLDDTDELDKFAARVRSPAESEKRGGAVFDDLDLDLGLDPTEDFDDNDPNDRRRSQYLMSQQLDAIERTMASLSPRFMTTSLEEEHNLSFNSASLSPSTPANLSLAPGRNSDFFPPPSPPRLPRHAEPDDDVPVAGQSWPAVPFSAIKERDQGGADRPPSPPRLALNGVSTSAPKSYMPHSVAPDGLSESERRKRELEEETLYSAPTALKHISGSADSPVIPMSPDPFGRHSSTPEPPTVQVSGAQWDTVTIGKGDTADMTFGGQQQPGSRPRSNTTTTNNTTTSRFSADSLTAQPEPAPQAQQAAKAAGNRATLISVKTIKKLWRKSSKSASGGQGAPAEAPPAVPPTPTGLVPPPPQRPERPPQDQLYFPGETPPPDMAVFPGSRASVEQSQNQRQSASGLMAAPAHANMMGRAAIPPPTSLLPSQDQLFPGGAGRRSLDRERAQGMQNGRLSPQGRPSLDQMPSTSRVSLEQQGRRPSQEQHGRPSLEQYIPSPPPPSQQQMQQMQMQQMQMQQQQQMQMQHQQQQMQHQQQQQQQQQQLNIPVFAGRNPNPGPIITPHLQASKTSSNLDRLHFDQESPYPTHRSVPSVQRSPRPPSPAALPAIPEGAQQQQQPQTQPQGVRKSILRWKSAASTSSASSRESEAHANGRPSLDRSSTSGSARSATGVSSSGHSHSHGGGGGGSGARRPSINNAYASTRTSMTTPDLPASPHVGQFALAGGGNGNGKGPLSPPARQTSLGPRSASPTGSRSRASSRDSVGSRPSFDASQFEFVSPKGTATLSYPYNAIDQQQ